jgi:hypothetical protein
MFGILNTAKPPPPNLNLFFLDEEELNFFTIKCSKILNQVPAKYELKRKTNSNSFNWK